jgi:hypothetical protein
VQVDVVERSDRVAQRGLERSIHLHDMDMADAGSEMLRQHTESATHLQYDIRVREIGGLGDQAQDVVVDKEVLAELAVRADAELAQPADASLAAHQPKMRAALRSTSSSSSS